MEMMLATVFDLLLFAVLCYLLFKLRRRGLPLSRQVFIGMLFGLAFGFYLQLIHQGDAGMIGQTLTWTQVPGDIYVALLQMIVMPLVLITMVAAVVRLQAAAALGKIGASVIGLLMFTTMLAALIGILVAGLFGLSAEGITGGAREAVRAAELVTRQNTLRELNLADVIVGFVPTNVFADLAGTRDTSIIAVVIFGMLFGLAALLVSREQPAQAERIRDFTETLLAVVMRLVKIIMTLTPYGILALMTYVVASSNGRDILNLISFVIASYLAILLMFGVHGVLLAMTGTGPLGYFRKIWPVLTFAFATRSSAAAIPLNIKTQVEELNVPSSIASLAASFGSTIGQNGCAGIYPAMLAVMVAPTVGIDPFTADFIFTLVAVIAISSFGVAGVGGGATFASLIVLPAMGLPVTLVALLISIEPLIDMGRTALNVSGAMTSGVVTGKFIRDGT